MQSTVGCHVLCKDPPPQKSKEDLALPCPPASLQDLSGPMLSRHISTEILLTDLQSAEGCHALYKDPPPYKSNEGRRLPRLLESLENLSGPQPFFQAFIVFS